MSRLASDPEHRVQFARRIAAGDASLRLYAILDAESCARRQLDPLAVARGWRQNGVRLMQYRDKQGSDADVVSVARQLGSIFQHDPDALLLLNDRAHLVAHLVAQFGWHGVHLGQGDLPVAQARALVGDGALIGISTHSADQALAANAFDVDYVAIGPVFATTTKVDAEPAVGVCGVQAARAVTRRPLVAIGGIGSARAGVVRAAGADMVAAISALLPVAGEVDPVAEFFRAMR